jgi:hypothetical protein
MSTPNQIVAPLIVIGDLPRISVQDLPEIDTVRTLVMDVGTPHRIAFTSNATGTCVLPGSANDASPPKDGEAVFLTTAGNIVSPFGPTVTVTGLGGTQLDVVMGPQEIAEFYYSAEDGQWYLLFHMGATTNAVLALNTGVGLTDSSQLSAGTPDLVLTSSSRRRIAIRTLAGPPPAGYRVFLPPDVIPGDTVILYNEGASIVVVQVFNADGSQTVLPALAPGVEGVFYARTGGNIWNFYAT